MLPKIRQEMAPWKSSKFLDALTSQSIGRDASDAGQRVGCSMAIVTRNDFDCVHEMNFLTKRQNQKSRRKRKRTSKRRGWRKEKRKGKKEEFKKKNLFLGNYRWHSVYMQGKRVAGIRSWFWYFRCWRAGVDVTGWAWPQQFVRLRPRTCVTFSFACNIR